MLGICRLDTALLVKERGWEPWVFDLNSKQIYKLALCLQLDNDSLDRLKRQVRRQKQRAAQRKYVAWCVRYAVVCAWTGVQELGYAHLDLCVAVYPGVGCASPSPDGRLLAVPARSFGVAFFIASKHATMVTLTNDNARTHLVGRRYQARLRRSVLSGKQMLNPKLEKYKIKQTKVKEK